MQHTEQRRSARSRLPKRLHPLQPRLSDNKLDVNVEQPLTLDSLKGRRQFVAKHCSETDRQENYRRKMESLKDVAKIEIFGKHLRKIILALTMISKWRQELSNS